MPKSIEDESPFLQFPSPGLQHNLISNNSFPLSWSPKDRASASMIPKLPNSLTLDAPNRICAPLAILDPRMVDDQPSLLQSTMTTDTSMSASWRTLDRHTRLPYLTHDLCKPLDIQWFTNTIVGQLEKLAGCWYFKLPNFQAQFCQVAVQRLRNSKFALWVSFVSLSVLESFITGDTSKSQLHDAWANSIEGSLRRDLVLDLTPHQMRDRWNALVHVSLMKTRFMPRFNAYQLLRGITPTFLQAAYSDPTLWPGHHDPTRIPLLNILASEFHELALFILVDCTYAVAYGLPQQVEYDTTIYPRPGCCTSHQWVHSSPLEFQLVLADINACRDMSSTAKNPKDIEEWLILWQPKLDEYAFAESWMTIAWYAVQESWRLALLVYLYLAIYNAPSDDPRIQLRVTQILQVFGTLKKRGPSHLNISLFFQYLMAGICARNETHRQLVWNKLVSAEETKFWFLRASDFAPVLDHLWHGPGAGGRPVRWSDYMLSREVVLPVV